MVTQECRICYDEENENSLALIHPCACDGTRKYVHRKCIEEWRHIKKGRIDYLQCQECRQFYNIGKKYKLEELKFQLELPSSVYEALGILGLNMVLIVFAPILKIMDAHYQIPETMSIGNSSSFIFFLKKNDEEAYCYYYSFTMFVLTFLVYMFLLYKIKYNIYYQHRYWNKAFIPFILTFLYNLHYYYLYLFILERNFSVYTITTGIMSLFNIFPILCFLGHHDRIINDLNTIDNEEYLKNYNHALRRSQCNIVISID